MSWKEFIIDLLRLTSFDVIFGFILYIGFQYFNRKYNSKLDISVLEEENKFLKEENKKINGASTDFWSLEDNK